MGIRILIVIVHCSDKSDVMKKEEMIHWCNLGVDIKSLYPRVIQPKFVFISIVTLAVSTCGIWIGPLFSQDYSQVGFSFFSFIIATLGVLAAESLSRDDGGGISFPSPEKYRKQVKVSFSVFLWVLSFVFSFYGINNNINLGLIVSFIITLILWISVTVVKPDFEIPITPNLTVQKELMKDNDEPGEGL